MATFRYFGLTTSANPTPTSSYTIQEPFGSQRLARVPTDRTYEPGDTIQFAGHGSEPNDYVFVGVEASTGYVILDRVGSNEYAILYGDTHPNPGGSSYSPSSVNTNLPARLGDAPLFANYGLRRKTSDLDEYVPQNREVEFDHGTYDVGDEVELRIVTRNADGDVDNIEYRFTARYQGFDQFTGDPIFDAPDNPPAGFPADRDIVLSDTPGGPTVPYNIARSHIITDVPFRTDVPFKSGDVRFSAHATRLDTDLSTIGTFAVPQDGSDGAVSFAHGFYQVDDTLTISRAGIDTQVTLVGYDSDGNYPIFLDAAGNGGAGRLIIAFNGGSQDVSYTVDAADFVSTGEYITCFAPGTLIATPAGERAVETLKPGEEVLTADGEVVSVRFVGFQKVPTMFGPKELTHPVRIRAGALGENTPHKDLVVTKDHGMIVDGVICHAGALINGTSIVEVPTRELGKVATYYHVETEGHVPLLANGAVAESFIDDVDRARFANHGEFVAMYGARVPAMTQMNLPRAMSARQVPRRIRTRLGLPEYDATVIIPAPAPSGLRRLWQELRDRVRSAGHRLARGRRAVLRG